MDRSAKIIRFLERLFWLFLFLNPLLDILNGFFIRSVMDVEMLEVETVSTLGVTPSLVVRMAFLLVFVAYILLSHDKKSILTALPIGLAWALSVASEYHLMGEVNIFVDVQYMARFCYNIALLMVYTRVFANRWGYDGRDLLAALDTISTYTVIILSLAILIPALLGIGYSTYADRLGYRGNRGFFYAGNDVTAVLTAFLPLLIAHIVKAREDMTIMSGKYSYPWVSAIAVALGVNAMMAIGSKTAFVALIITLAAFAGYTVICLLREKNSRPLLDYLKILGLIAAVFIILSVISYLSMYDELLEKGEIEPGFHLLDVFRSSGFIQGIGRSASATSTIAKEEGAANALLNGRQFKLKKQFVQFLHGGVITWLFGMGRGSQEVVVEMDLIEVLLYYGVFGVTAMLWLYVKLAVDFFKNLAKKFDIRSFAAFLALAMVVGYLTIAGHVLFSVTSGFYLVFTILYSRVYFAAQATDVLLWNT